MQTAFSPRSRAVSRPRASARFEITTAISASSAPAAHVPAIASKFDPRPESQNAEPLQRYSTPGRRALCADHLADAERRLAQLAQQRSPPSRRLAPATARIMPTPRLKVRR